MGDIYQEDQVIQVFQPNAKDEIFPGIQLEALELCLFNFSDH